MKKILLNALIITILATGCTNMKKENKTEAGTEEIEDTQSAIQKEDFGTLPDGTNVEAYTFTNNAGMKMKVITYGGIITEFEVPDTEGDVQDIVLGYDNLEGYLDETPYFGAIVGRYGNRIANGKFTLNGEEYTLATNNGPNHLHGGIKGFDKVVWTVEETFDNDNGSGIRLKYVSPDGEEGYPGTLTTLVTYTLTDDGLNIQYEATTDKATVVNLTQHSYFNLSGEADNDILDHVVSINADHFLPVDETLIPTGELRPVEGTPFDFTTPKRVGEEINADNRQIEYGKGYDHCWVLNGEGMRTVATVHHPESGRFMEVLSQEPGIQFYTGNFLDGSITGKDGIVYEQRHGLCLETQHFPDSPNQKDFPSVVLNPGETYSTQTTYRFSVK